MLLFLNFLWNIFHLPLVQNFLLFLFSFFFLLFLYLEEKNNIFFITICSFVYYKVTKVFLGLSLVFFFYLIHPFIALYLIAFFACFPILLDQDKQKNNIYFIHFFSYFLYRYFFFFSILFASFLSLFSFSVEPLIVNFLMEKVSDNEISCMMFGKGISKHIFKEVEWIRGDKKVDFLLQNQLRDTKNLAEIVTNSLEKSAYELHDEIAAKNLPKDQQLLVWDYAVKFNLHLVDHLRNKSNDLSYLAERYFASHPAISPETKGVIEKFPFNPKFLPFASDTLLIFDNYKYFNYYNELSLTHYFKTYGKEEDVFQNIILARTLDAIIYESSSSTSEKMLRIVCEDDTIPSEKLKEKVGLIIFKKEAPYVKLSSGQDLRLFLDFGDKLQRPTDGKTHDFYIRIGDQTFSIEDKLIMTNFAEQEQAKDLKNYLAKPDVQEKHVKVLFKAKGVKNALNKEAIPFFDLTPQFFFFKEKFNGDFDSFVSDLVKKSPRMQKHISMDKSVVFYSKSSIDQPLLLKSYNCPSLNLENNNNLIKNE